MVSLTKLVKKVTSLFTPAPKPDIYLQTTTSIETLITLGPASSPRLDTVTTSPTGKTTKRTQRFSRTFVPTLHVASASDIPAYNVSPPRNKFKNGQVSPRSSPSPTVPQGAAMFSVGSDGRMRGLKDFGECQEAGKYAVRKTRREYRGGKHFPSTDNINTNNASRHTTTANTAIDIPTFTRIHSTATFDCSRRPIIVSLPSHTTINNNINNKVHEFAIGQVVKCAKYGRDGRVVWA